MQFGDYSCFSFVDVETTGTSASQDRVLEIGIIRVENGKVTGEINTLIDAGVYIPPEITMITGITEKDILNAPTFPDVVDKVQELLEGSIFVAHNARFDHAFIRHEFRRLGIPFSPKTLDTVRLARQIYPGLPRYNLDSIISFLGVTIEHRHRAYDDALVLHKLLERIYKEFKPEQTREIFNTFLKSPTLPQFISKEQINALPEGPGVYLMYGENNSLLYVGKSVDVRARVLSHFYNDFESATDLKLNREVRKVDAIKTAGDLGASLLEASLIKELHPVHNRLLRRYKGLLVAQQIEKNGYLTIKILPLEEVNTNDINQILFVGQNKKQIQERIIEKAKEFKLCLKILEIEKGKGSCFGTQIGLCNGACTGDEPAFKYNVRFLEAFSENRIPSWPFPGPIGISEKFEDIEEVHIIDNWCLLGTVRNENDLVENILLNDQIFDWDSYKIIYRYLKSHVRGNIVNIERTERAIEERENVEQS